MSIFKLKEMDFLNYLMEVSSGERPPITPEIGFLAKTAWHLILEQANFTIPVPSACTGPDGQMFYSWNNGQHHLELEIIPNQPAEFFYCNRDNNKMWGEDYIIGDPIPVEITKVLNFFRGT